MSEAAKPIQAASTSDLNVVQLQALPPPHEIIALEPTLPSDFQLVTRHRETIQNILLGEDRRFIVILGPCSIHSYDSAMDYAKRLAAVVDSLDKTRIFPVMRVYFEKPRSRGGWKGFLYDPDLDDTCDVVKGLRLCRSLLLNITRLGLPIACEFLDVLTPQYIADLVAWGAIGARTAESQLHRQLASGLSMPIGFKNLSSGDVAKAIDGIVSGTVSHQFLGADENGRISRVRTRGNPFCHLVLRGGDNGPNYDDVGCSATSALLNAEKLKTGFIVDCSHGNSQKDHRRQPLIALTVFRKWLSTAPSFGIRGIMVESNLCAGRQDLGKGPLKYGVSVTDACIGWDASEALLRLLADVRVADGGVLSADIDAVRAEISQLDSIIAARMAAGDAAPSMRALVAELVEGGVKLFPSKLVVSRLNSEETLESLSHSKDDGILWLLYLRTALAERVAAVKLANDVGAYLLASNELLSLVTNRSVEKSIGSRHQHGLVLKAIELSKKAQTVFIEKVLDSTKVGYLFGKGTFSHEAVGKLRGTKIAFGGVDALKGALRGGHVDFIVLPVYNSHIGAIYNVDDDCEVVAIVDHPIELAFYSNRPISVKSKIRVDVLSVERHVLAEAKSWVEKHVEAVKIHDAPSSKASVVEVVAASTGADIVVAAVASKHLGIEGIVHMIDISAAIAHNVTDFAVVRLKSAE